MLNKKIKSILAMLLVLCLTMGLVACGSSGAKDNVTDSGATNSGQTSETKDNNDGESETAEFALLVKTFANESQQNLKRGMEEAAEKLGVKVDMYATIEYLRSGNIVKAVQYGNIVGAISVTKLGAQPSLPTIFEVEEFIENRELMNNT